MSDRRNLNEGESTVFSTRPVGMKTTLFVIPWPLGPDTPVPTIAWHIELCCQTEHVDTKIGEIDISAAAGALVCVQARAGGAQVWTDY